MKESEEKGIEKGMEKRNWELAKNMKKEDIDTLTIAKITGLSLEEIEKL